MTKCPNISLPLPLPPLPNSSRASDKATSGQISPTLLNPFASEQHHGGQGHGKDGILAKVQQRQAARDLRPRYKCGISVVVLDEHITSRERVLSAPVPLTYIFRVFFFPDKAWSTVLNLRPSPGKPIRQGVSAFKQHGSSFQYEG